MSNFPVVTRPVRPNGHESNLTVTVDPAPLVPTMTNLTAQQQEFDERLIEIARNQGDLAYDFEDYRRTANIRIATLEDQLKEALAALKVAQARLPEEPFQREAEPAPAKTEADYRPEEYIGGPAYMRLDGSGSALKALTGATTVMRYLQYADPDAGRTEGRLQLFPVRMYRELKIFLEASQPGGGKKRPYGRLQAFRKWYRKRNPVT
jgi:hypothetical protein